MTMQVAMLLDKGYCIFAAGEREAAGSSNPGPSFMKPAVTAIAGKKTDRRM